MTVETPPLPMDPVLERRALVQASARQSLARRTFISRLMLGVCMFALVLASSILVWIMYLLVSKGLHWWSVDFFTQVPTTPTVLHPNAVGGISNAIVGSIVIDAFAIAMSVPIGVLGGLLLAEADNLFLRIVRTTSEVMTGLPSIIFGLFVYEILIIKYKIGFSGIAGSVALCILMIPIIMKGSEIAFRAVPSSLREAGYSLGMSKGSVARHVVTPTATPGLLTAILLATSRAVGETAPLLFVIGNTYIVQWNATKEQISLPQQIYTFFLDGYSPAQEQIVWGIALLLVVVVLFLNMGSRLLSAFLQRERH